MMKNIPGTQCVGSEKKLKEFAVDERESRLNIICGLQKN